MLQIWVDVVENATICLGIKWGTNALFADFYRNCRIFIDKCGKNRYRLRTSEAVNLSMRKIRVEKICERIRAARESRKISQGEMAHRMGIDRSTYINFEHGRTQIISEHLPAFAEIMGISEEELIFGEPEQQSHYLHEGDMSERLDDLSLRLDRVELVLERVLAKLDKKK